MGEQKQHETKILDNSNMKSWRTVIRIKVF